jgi:hypothetical protein
LRQREAEDCRQTCDLWHADQLTLPASQPGRTSSSTLLLVGRSDVVRSIGAAQPAPRGIRSTFPPVGLRADGAYLMPDI